MSSSVNHLKGLASLALFLSSYMPLFILVSIRQLYYNSEYLSWGGFNIQAFVLMTQMFTVSIICSVLVVFGFIGTYFVFKYIQAYSPNGYTVNIDTITNMNDEPIAYLATYIIPLLFQGYSNWVDGVTLISLFYITYCLYTKSKLILVNPILGLKYHIYSFSFSDGEVQRQGVLITSNKDILENECIKIYNIGYQLYFGYRGNLAI